MELYRHFKGGTYARLTDAYYHDMNHHMVVYQAMDGPNAGLVFVRSHKQFHGKVPNLGGAEVQRFTLIEQTR